MQSRKVAKNFGRSNGKSASKQKENRGAVQRSASRPRPRQKKQQKDEDDAADDSSAGSSKNRQKQNSKKRYDKIKKSGKQVTTAEAGNLQEYQISIRIPSGLQQDPWPQRISISILYAILVLLQ
jgi:ATPase subunit of ABC transporter with duplicated ATPase domains